MQKRWQSCHLLEYFLGFDFVVAMPANKIGMFLLQILNETHGVTAVATVAAHARYVRADAEVVREVAIASGRPIESVVLQIAHIGAVAITRSGEEDRTCGFE